MSYEVFQNKVKSLVKRAGGDIKIQFGVDDGKYIARCDEATITGNSKSRLLTFRWGTCHQAMALV